MTTPTIVQSAFGRAITSASTLSATLASSPTAGNSILVLQIGDAWFGNVSPPISFIQTMNIASNAAIILTNYYKVAPITGTTYTITYTSTGSAYGNIAVFEISNARLDSPADVSPTLTVMTAAATVTTPALATAADSGGLRFAVMAWYGPVGIPTPNPPTGWTLLSPTSWMATSGVGTNGNGAIWQIPNSSTGSQSLTFSGSPTNIVYLDLQVMQASTGSLVVPRADLASSKPAYVGKAISSPVTTTAQRSAFQSTTSAYYGSGDYVGQWSPAAASKSINGYVKENGTPVSKTVCLYNRQTGALVSTVQSNASTGFYSFTGLSPNIVYEVVAYDSPMYNSQIYDYVVPS